MRSALNLNVLRGRGLLPWLVALCLAGCALGPRSIEVPQARLEQLIKDRFPHQTRVLELLDVTVAAPRVRLLPDANRIATDLEVSVSDRVFGRAFTGAITLSHGLRFEAADGTVRLTNVQVNRFEIAGLPAPLQRQLERIGLLLAEQSLNDRVVYTLRAQDVDAMRTRGRHPGELRVTAGGLLITFVPDEPR